MATKKYMRLDSFCDIYDVNMHTIRVGKSSGTIPSYVFITPQSSKLLHIDANYFTRRKEFRLQQQRYCHEMYYFL